MEEGARMWYQCKSYNKYVFQICDSWVLSKLYKAEKCVLEFKKDGKKFRIVGNNIDKILYKAKTKLDQLEKQKEIYGAKKAELEKSGPLTFKITDQVASVPGECHPAQFYTTATLSLGRLVVNGQVNSWDESRLYKKLVHALYNIVFPKDKLVESFLPNN